MTSPIQPPIYPSSHQTSANPVHDGKEQEPSPAVTRQEM